MANGRTIRACLAGVALISLTACEALPDWDLRDLGEGFDTSAAVENLPDRPRPDDRGVISYPNYQVVIARQDDTIRTVAARLNLDANTLGSFNGIAPDTPLRRDEVIALPSRVTEPSPATGAATTGPIQPLDVTAVATTALDRVGPQASVTTTPIATPTQPPAGTGTEPIRHQVQRGETAFSISRLYNVPVRNITEWNGLGSDLAVREGQQLLIPQGGAPAPAPTTPVVEEPGSGSETPVPPSASVPLPVDDTDPETATVAAPETPDIGAATTPAVAAPPVSSPSARFSYPVQGSIIRAFAPGRNDGIDIGVPAGTAVKAAGAGTVAAVTTDTQGIAIVVIRHADGLLTVYTNLENLSVAKDASVASGQTIGQVRAGSPSFLHFEVRRGVQPLDPIDFLP